MVQLRGCWNCSVLVSSVMHLSVSLFRINSADWTVKTVLSLGEHCSHPSESPGLHQPSLCLLGLSAPSSPAIQWQHKHFFISLFDKGNINLTSDFKNWFLLLVYFFDKQKKPHSAEKYVLISKSRVVQRSTHDPVKVCSALSVLIVAGNWQVPPPFTNVLTHTSAWILQSENTFKDLKKLH